jgi:glycosyltransferase involved in cell wall biosynthesis
MRNRQVLMVSFVFYPCAEVGAHRAGKFAKYLPEFGWDPRILTLKEKHYEIRDNDLCTQISAQAEVIRTGYLGIEILRPFLLGLKSRKKTTPSPKNPPQFKRVTRPAPESWFDLPRGVGWLPFGLLRGIAAAGKCDVIWGTSPQPAGLCLAALLSRLTQKPFIADLQDPWRVEEVMPYPTRLHKTLNQWWEKFVINTARVVLVVTDEAKAMYEQQYSGLGGKIIVLPMGYDPADFGESLQSAGLANEEDFRIGYFGSLYQGRESCMLQLMQAIKTMAKKNPCRKIRMYVRGLKPERAILLADAAEVHHLVDIGGPVSHNEAIEMMKKMDILALVATSKHTHQLPAKVFEYMGAGRPVLAVTPDGATARFVQKHGIGITVDPGGTGEIEMALETIMKNYGFYLEQIKIAAPKFTARALAGELATILTKILDKT